MKTYCPNCEKETDQRFIQSTDQVNIRGELITVQSEYYHCNVCGEEYEHFQPGYDPMDKAYRQFRERKGLLQPEEIKDFRKKLGLSQKEFSKLLGIGIATLNRYENGALQSESHDQNIRFCMEPNNLREILNSKKEKFSDETTERIMEQLKSADSGCSDLVNEVVSRFGEYPADVKSGFMPLDINKLSEVIKFFSYSRGIDKIKLMEMLFKSDLYHFKRYGTSITGLRYSFSSFGPTPEKFDTWLTIVKEWRNDIKSEISNFFNQLVEVFTSESPNLNFFKPSEIHILNSVNERFMEYKPNFIAESIDFEATYKVSNNEGLISYELAVEKLKLDDIDVFYNPSTTQSLSYSHEIRKKH